MTVKTIMKASAAIVLAVSGIGTANAAVLTGNSSSSLADPLTIFAGQSFTIDGTGNFNNITASFSQQNTGTLYLFNSAYVGTPDGLATANGVLGSASVSSGLFTFAPSLTLAAGTKYFAYLSAAQSIFGSSANPYVGGNMFMANSATTSFQSFLSQDLVFQINGTPVAAAAAVPEPASWALMLVGFGAIGFAMRRRPTVRTTVTYA